MGLEHSQEQFEWAIPYLKDISVYREAAMDPLTDPNDFEHSKLSQAPGMDWLSAINVGLIAPSSKNLDIQKSELGDFFDRLKLSASITLSQDDFPGVFPVGFSGKVVSVDTETTGLDLRWKYDYNGLVDPKSLLVGASIATSEVQSWYLPVRHTESDGVINWDPGVIAEFLNRVHQEFVVVYHNAQYDRELLSLNGVDQLRPYPYFFDTQILDFMRNVNDKRHGLKHLSVTQLQRKMIEIHELFLGVGELAPKKGTAPIYFWKLPAKTAFVYAASDSMNTISLFQRFVELDKPFNSLSGQYISCGIDHKTSDALRSMLRTGLPIQYRFFYYAALDTEARLSNLRNSIMKFVGYDFDLDSTKELSTVLFDKMGVPPPMGEERNKLGVYTTAADALELLVKEYPNYLILNWVVLYRSLQSTISKIFIKGIMNSYTDAALPWLRVKLDYSLTNVPTGRLSSSSGDSRERVKAKFNKKSTSWTYMRGSWHCGFNSQGIPSDKYWTAPARRITRLPDGVKFDETYPGYSENNRYPDDLRESVLKRIVGV